MKFHDQSAHTAVVVSLALRIIISIVAILLIIFFVMAGYRRLSPLPGAMLTKVERETPQAEFIASVEEPFVHKLRIAIESVLSNPAHEGQPPVPQGTRLLNLRVLDTGTVIETEIDLSKEILELGTGVELEDFLHNIATGVNNEIAGQRKETRYTFLIEGIPLSEYR